MKHPKTLIEKYNLTQATLHALLDYCPESGRFTWKRTDLRPANWNGNYAGKQAGYINSAGRRVMAIMSGGKKRRYYANVLAWLYMTGEWPEGEVDHKNRDRSDDRWGNLRGASESQNKFNQGKHADNTTGIKGVSFDKRRGKFTAQIQAFKKFKHLGRFDTAEDAGEAYAKAAAEYHGEFARVA